MKAAEEPYPLAEVVFDAVPEGQRAARREAADRTEHGDEPVLRDAAEDEDGPRPEEPPLADQVLPAAADFFRQRLVRGRRAAGHGGDVAVAQLETVAACDGSGLAREPGAVEPGEQEIAGAIAGEDAAGAVAAVGGRREPHDQ